MCVPAASSQLLAAIYNGDVAFVWNNARTPPRARAGPSPRHAPHPATCKAAAAGGGAATTLWPPLVARAGGGGGATAAPVHTASSSWSYATAATSLLSSPQKATPVMRAFSQHTDSRLAACRVKGGGAGGGSRGQGCGSLVTFRPAARAPRSAAAHLPGLY